MIMENKSSVYFEHIHNALKSYLNQNKNSLKMISNVSNNKQEEKEDQLQTSIEISRFLKSTSLERAQKALLNSVSTTVSESSESSNETELISPKTGECERLNEPKLVPLSFIQYQSSLTKDLTIKKSVIASGEVLFGVKHESNKNQVIPLESRYLVLIDDALICYTSEATVRENSNKMLWKISPFSVSSLCTSTNKLFKNCAFELSFIVKDAPGGLLVYVFLTSSETICAQWIRNICQFSGILNLQQRNHGTCRTTINTEALKNTNNNRLKSQRQRRARPSSKSYSSPSPTGLFAKVKSLRFGSISTNEPSKALSSSPKSSPSSVVMNNDNITQNSLTVSSKPSFATLSLLPKKSVHTSSLVDTTKSSEMVQQSSLQTIIPSIKSESSKCSSPSWPFWPESFNPSNTRTKSTDIVSPPSILMKGTSVSILKREISSSQKKSFDYDDIYKNEEESLKAIQFSNPSAKVRPASFSDISSSTNISRSDMLSDRPHSDRRLNYNNNKNSLYSSRNASNRSIRRNSKSSQNSENEGMSDSEKRVMRLVIPGKEDNINGSKSQSWKRSSQSRNFAKIKQEYLASPNGNASKTAFFENVRKALLESRDI